MHCLLRGTAIPAVPHNLQHTCICLIPITTSRTAHAVWKITTINTQKSHKSAVWNFILFSDTIWQPREKLDHARTTMNHQKSLKKFSYQVFAYHQCLALPSTFWHHPYKLVNVASCSELAKHFRNVYSHDRRVLSTPVDYSHDDQWPIRGQVTSQQAALLLRTIYPTQAPCFTPWSR